MCVITRFHCTTNHAASTILITATNERQAPDRLKEDAEKVECEIELVLAEKEVHVTRRVDFQRMTANQRIASTRFRVSMLAKEADT